MKKRFFICFIFVACLLFAGKAQPYYFRHYQVENGLSNNTVFCCVQDSMGFIWMGTKDGLNRFDGYVFKTFRNDPDDSSSIGDNFIRSLHIDAENNLYVGTRNGLYKYNFSLENFSLLYQTISEVRDINTDNNGNIWIVAGQTLIRYNKKSNTSYTFDPKEYFAATSICIDSEQNVWVSTSLGFLMQYDAAFNKFKQYQVFGKSQNLLSRWIEKIYATNQQSILIGTSNYGVKIFNLKDHSYKDVLTYNPDKTEVFARDFIVSSDSEFWMATESGIFIYNINTGKITNLQKQNINPYSLSDNAVYTLCKDKEGGIWAGTYFGGINYFPKQYNSFEKYFPENTNTSLSGNVVREICEDRYGNLWIGTEDAGLNKFNKQTRQFTHYKPSGSSFGISYSNIHGLLAKNNELWVGTFEHGLDIMDIKSGKVINHFPQSKNSTVVKSNFIVTIFETKKGDIYIGTRLGLYRFDPLINNFISVTQIPTSCFIHTIMEDNTGVLWVGTTGDGIFYIDPASGKFGNFVNSPHNKKSLSNNSVTTIFQDNENNLWFGTEGGGLCRFNKDDSSFTTITAKDGLPCNTICKILEDSRENLWISTTNGLVKYNLATRRINTYTTDNGLLNDQFNYNSGYKDATGRMYFGSVKGLISFNPDSFTPNNYTPSIFITSIYVNNEELKADKAFSPLNESVLFQKSIELPYDQSTINIAFAALGFTAPEMVEYKYIMEGMDDKWTYLKTNRPIYFTSLPPGTYKFRVKEATDVLNGNEASLTIKILPPFWKSPIAYVLYSVVLLFIVYLLLKSYHGRLSEKNKRTIQGIEYEKEKEIYQAKIDFFTKVAHEIRTPLTLIKAPLEKVIKKAGQNAEIGQNLTIMERNTQRLIELTNQLLDFRKIETNTFHLHPVNINISELLYERYISFKGIAEQKNMNFTIHLPEEPVYISADVDALHKIFNNLFYNAFHYGKEIVTVKLSNYNTEQIEIEFCNDGFIIPASMKEKIFEPFYRLADTQHKPGSGIGLALSRSLATLHNGSLYFKADTQGMNTFVLCLPKSNTKKTEVD